MIGPWDLTIYTIGWAIYILFLLCDGKPAKWTDSGYNNGTFGNVFIDVNSWV